MARTLIDLPGRYARPRLCEPGPRPHHARPPPGDQPHAESSGCGGDLLAVDLEHLERHPRVVGLLEVLMGRAVVTSRQRLALAGRALAGVGAAVAHHPVEPGSLRQSLEELERQLDVGVDHPPDAQLIADREVRTHLAEERARRTGEIATIGGEPADRLLACVEDELLVPAPGRIMLDLNDSGSDLSIDRSAESVHLSLPLVVPVRGASAGRPCTSPLEAGASMPIGCEKTRAID